MLLKEAKEILKKKGYIVESDEQVLSKSKLLTLANYAEDLSRELEALIYYQDKGDVKDFNADANYIIEYYVNKINEIKNSL